MIAQIELGMTAALKAAADAGILGYRWETLETYPEDWDAYLKEKVDWRAPAAWAVFGGASDLRFTDLGNVRFDGAQFGLVVAAENLRNETATRHGGPSVAAEPGSYQLMLDAVAVLAGSTLGLDIDPLMPVAVRQVRPFEALRERKVSMLAIQFTTGFEFTTLPDEATLDELRSIHLDWDVRPFGGIDGDAGEDGINLPAPDSGPGSADASDHLILPQE